jgi:hypothetical protein
MHAGLRIYAGRGRPVTRLDSAITVEPAAGRRDRLTVVIDRPASRRKRRTLELSMDEAAILAAQLERHLPAVAVRRRVPEGGGR